MIDDVATRVALTIAAVSLLATGLSLISVVGGESVRDAAERLAVHVARQLDAVGRLEGVVSLRGGHVADGPFALPASLLGRGYRLEFQSRSVGVAVDGVAIVAPLVYPVYPFSPGDAPGSSEELEDLARGSRVIVNPGDTFLVDRLLLRVDGVRTHLTFVWLPH